MSDSIDRQAAIDALNGDVTVTGRANADAVLGYANLICDRIKRLPSADVQPVRHGRWIPVSEQLPEDEQEVLFSTKTGRVHLGRYRNDNSVNQWYSSLDKMRAWNNVVNAWMPLPEPYEEKHED